MKMKMMIAALAVLTYLGWGSNAHAYEVPELGVDIHGFISQGFINSSEYNYITDDSRGGSFAYNEMGLNFSKELTDKLRLGLQLFARDVGDAGNNKITLDWAYGDYRWKDWLGVRAGKIKIPRGIFNEIRDMDMLRTCIILPQGIYSELTRDTAIALNGGSVYGHVPLQKLGSIDYQALIGNMDVDGDSGMDKYMSSSFLGFASPTGDYDLDTSTVGSLQWNTPVEGLFLKSTILFVEGNVGLRLEFPPVIGAAGEAELETRAFVISAQYNWNDLTLIGEYAETKQDSKLITPIFTSTSSKTSQQYYLMGSYRLTDRLELGAYYSVSYPDKDDKDGDNMPPGFDHLAWQKDAALSCRFDINEYWVAKVEGHLVDGAADVLAIDNADRSEDSWYYFAAKLSFSF